MMENDIKLGAEVDNNQERDNKKLELKIDGISCQACVAKIERKLSKTNGVGKALVNISNNMADIEYNEKEIKASEIMKIIEKLGYTPKRREDLKDKEEALRAEKNLKSELTKSKIVIVLSLILMYISMSHMFGLPVPHIIYPVDNIANYVAVQFIITVTVMIIGKRFYKVGFRQLFMLSPNMDSLVAVGTSSAFVYSLYISYKIFADKNIHLMHSLYYESAAMIIAFVMLGKYLETLSKGKASAAIKKLVNFQAKKANIIRNGEIIEIGIEEVSKGDTVFIKPGEKIPVDGVIIEGHSTIDEAMITGESIPVEKSENDKVYSGSINKDGALKVVVNATEGETLISKIAKLVEDAQMTKAPIARLADKVSLIFVPTVIFIAIFAALLWWFLIKYNVVSTSMKAVEKGLCNLSHYQCVDIALGLQRNDGHSLVNYKTFTPIAQKLIREYAHKNGRLIVSGAYVATDMRDSLDQVFLSDVFKASFNGAVKTDTLLAAIRPLANDTDSIARDSVVALLYKSPNAIHYAPTKVDVLTPLDGATTGYRYTGWWSASVAYVAGNRRSHIFGFPLECIKDSEDRRRIMAEAIDMMMK